MDRYRIPTKLPFSLLLFVVSSTYAALPYTPTRILAVPNSNGQDVYILEPPSPSSPKGKLSKLSKSSHLRSTKLPTTTISSSLPFLEQDANVAFTSVIAQDGSISVYTGSCSNGSQGSSLWQFTPEGSKGVWTKRSYNIADMGQTAVMSGANWLASGISFSSNISDPDNIFLFGGMCPSVEAGTTGTWTSDATYSNQLLVFEAQAASDQHDFTLTPGQGQPTPEAGFSITPLPPTHSRSTDGSKTLQQDFVLVGGHTETAFIDMNMIALFSLPQSSWSFLPVETPSDKTDLLASRHSYYVDARSGHTAVLTTDGQKVVVFGGWVGDVSTPAEPQLTILQVGAGYGGSGSWMWSNSHEIPFAPGDGLYGHGAVMLPGDVMLVTGGYSISESSGPHNKRAVQTRNTQNHFLNTTSGQWLKSYDLSKALPGLSDANDSSGPLDSSNEKAGLGAGLGFGLLALICIIFFFVCYRRRMKRERQQIEDEDEAMREKEVEDLETSASHHTDYPNLGRTSIDGRGGSINAYGVWDSRRRPPGHGYSSPYGNNISGMREAQRSGVDLNIPSPNRGLRHSIAKRPTAYHSAPRYDESRYHWTSGDMHAIEERDEENSSAETSRQPSMAHARPGVAMVNDGNDGDPFRDPDPEPSALSNPNHPMLRRVQNQIPRPTPDNPSPAEERQREMSGWIRDWAAVDAVSRTNTTSTSAGRHSPSKSGRSSPSKSDRTESNLSDKSTRSNLSARSGTALFAGANTAPNRNTSVGSSIRSYLPSILPAIITNPFASYLNSPAHDSSSGEAIARSVVAGISIASRPGTSSGSGGDAVTDRADSFATAKSNSSHVQAENDALLATLPDLSPDTEPTFTRRNTNSGSPVRSGRPSVIGGWVGSVRRGVGKAITATVTGRTTSLTSETTKTRGVIGSDGYYEYTPTSSPSKSEHDLRHGQRSSSSSPSKNKRQSLPDGQERIDLDDEADGEADPRAMRRSVSDGAAFWAAKRGANDWIVDAEPLPAHSRARHRPDSQQTVVSLLPTQRQRSLSTGMAWNTESAWWSKVNTSAGASVSTAAGVTLGSTQGARSTSAGGQQSMTNDAASDWDVEAAVEQRVVQVMFTVPREKLRVVNADVDVASLVSTLRDDEDWMEGSRELNGEKIWAIAENKIMEEIGEVPEEDGGVAQSSRERLEEEDKKEQGKA